MWTFLRVLQFCLRKVLLKKSMFIKALPFRRVAWFFLSIFRYLSDEICFHRRERGISASEFEKTHQSHRCGDSRTCQEWPRAICDQLQDCLQSWWKQIHYCQEYRWNRQGTTNKLDNICKSVFLGKIIGTRYEPVGTWCLWLLGHAFLWL